MIMPCFHSVLEVLYTYMLYSFSLHNLSWSQLKYWECLEMFDLCTWVTVIFNPSSYHCRACSITLGYHLTGALCYLVFCLIALFSLWALSIQFYITCVITSFVFVSFMPCCLIMFSSLDFFPARLDFHPLKYPICSPFSSFRDRSPVGVKWDQAGLEASFS